MKVINVGVGYAELAFDPDTSVDDMLFEISKTSRLFNGRIHKIEFQYNTYDRTVLIQLEQE